VLAWQNFAGQDNEPVAGLALGDLQVTQMPMDTEVARMDLVFALAERWSEAGEPAGIGGAVEFRTDVFDAESIETLIERLQRVLVAITADPVRRLSSVDLLDAAEHARLDEIGNRAVLTHPAPALSIPALWAAQVACTPAGVALVCGEHSWTYREVEDAANRLAHLLAGHGVASGDVVALLFERSAEAIIAILGVLKTGATYVPTPHRWPPSPPPGWLTGWTGRICWLSISTTPPSTVNPAQGCRTRPLRTSPTSSTRQVPPVPPRVLRSPTPASPTW
jgi:non-ribosomal peptide synthetase component F